MTPRPGLLITQSFNKKHGEALAAVLQATGLDVEVIRLSNERGATLDEPECERVQIAFLSGDLYPGNFRGFFESLTRCPNLKWVHVFYVGIEGPLWVPLFERGVLLTNSAGANGRYIAQTAIGAVLALSRPFQRWSTAQREHAWHPVPSDQSESPTDLADETMLVVGLGAIGAEVARLAKALGLKVVGIRRSGAGAADVDVLADPSRLDEHLPSANWLVLASPLTEETRGLIDSRRLALLPDGARVLNVSRGAVIDEEALIRELESGRLGGAYLDVFAEEPLPAESPLWDLPDVIISPHNSTASINKDRREAELFFDNLRRWSRGTPLRNQVKSLGIASVGS
jgi:D-2-hydroxyacid dehydrogenase (NADP+)